MSSKVASSSQTQYHARIIAQKYISRQLLALATDIRLKVFDETQDVEDLISEIRGKLTDISSLNTEHDCIQINPVIDEDISDRKSTRLNSSHIPLSRMPSSA